MIAWIGGKPFEMYSEMPTSNSSKCGESGSLGFGGSPSSARLGGRLPDTLLSSLDEDGSTSIGWEVVASSSSVSNLILFADRSPSTAPSFCMCPLSCEVIEDVTVVDGKDYTAGRLTAVTEV